MIRSASTMRAWSILFSLCVPTFAGTSYGILAQISGNVAMDDHVIVQATIVIICSVVIAGVILGVGIRATRAFDSLANKIDNIDKYGCERRLSCHQDAADHRRDIADDSRDNADRARDKADLKRGLADTERTAEDQQRDAHEPKGK